ncbi:hypothetical protein [Christiangramia sabulilitoris]|uniref:STAS/SEC14 domain-containing protein n=1 Tax=Christiangramia sabulilitoris TaxID=2583991 RepID=A0A550I5Q6_9FLAO|nr:hypothetical protein [Christiangramia sabulilitoris]TRO66310.1 hypothetical protein FGM01_00055 [Christiangramia sabulilitoris]
MTTIRKLELSFTYLEFFESVVISTVKEDIIFDQHHIAELRKICRDNFDGKPFVYITNRKYNYNVNPVVYINLIQTNTLKGIAVVSDKPERLKTANFEKNFSPVPYELFDTKEKALSWAKNILEEVK